jgi:hypothetical protein
MVGDTKAVKQAIRNPSAYFHFLAEPTDFLGRLSKASETLAKKALLSSKAFHEASDRGMAKDSTRVKMESTGFESLAVIKNSIENPLSMFEAAGSEATSKLYKEKNAQGVIETLRSKLIVNNHSHKEKNAQGDIETLRPSWQTAAQVIEEWNEVLRSEEFEHIRSYEGFEMREMSSLINDSITIGAAGGINDSITAASVIRELMARNPSSTRRDAAQAFFAQWQRVLKEQQFFAQWQRVLKEQQHHHQHHQHHQHHHRHHHQQHQHQHQHQMAKASEPLAKKLAIMRLKPKLEPKLKEQELEWEDVVPVLEEVDTIEELKGAINEPAAFLEKLAMAGGPAAKKLAIVYLKPKLRKTGPRLAATGLDELERAAQHPEQSLTRLEQTQDEHQHPQLTEAVDAASAAAAVITSMATAASTAVVLSAAVVHVLKDAKLVLKKKLNEQRLDWDDIEVALCEVGVWKLAKAVIRTCNLVKCQAERLKSMYKASTTRGQHEIKRNVAEVSSSSSAAAAAAAVNDDAQEKEAIATAAGALTHKVLLKEELVKKLKREVHDYCYATGLDFSLDWQGIQLVLLELGSTRELKEGLVAPQKFVQQMKRSGEQMARQELLAKLKPLLCNHELGFGVATTLDYEALQQLASSEKCGDADIDPEKSMFSTQLENILQRILMQRTKGARTLTILKNRQKVTQILSTTFGFDCWHDIANVLHAIHSTSELERMLAFLRLGNIKSFFDRCIARGEEAELTTPPTKPESRPCRYRHNRLQISWCPPLSSSSTTDQLALNTRTEYSEFRVRIGLSGTDATQTIDCHAQATTLVIKTQGTKEDRAAGQITRCIKRWVLLQLQPPTCRLPRVSSIKPPSIKPPNQRQKLFARRFNARSARKTTGWIRNSRQGKSVCTIEADFGEVLESLYAREVEKRVLKHRGGRKLDVEENNFQRKLERHRFMLEVEHGPAAMLRISVSVKHGREWGAFGDPGLVLVPLHKCLLNPAHTFTRNTKALSNTSGCLH